MIAFAALAASTFVSEDLACIAAGALVAHGDLTFASAASACAAGIFLGDLMMFAAGRLGGAWLLRQPWFSRRIPPGRLDRALAWVTERQTAAVLLTRFIPGSRVVSYFAAGMVRANALRFTAALALAAAVWAPLLVGASAIFGSAFARTTAGLAAGIAAGGVLFWGLSKLQSSNWRRLAHWEFWPQWMAYAPVVPYVAWLALKHRSATLFMAANPGIDTGGFFGESKSQILDRLRPAVDHMPRHTLIGASGPTLSRVHQAIDFMERERLNFPVVLKPDSGERGTGVSVVRSQAELWHYLDRTNAATILQQHVPGVEFGVFYYRFPGEAQGHIYSITEKRFPTVTGDGVTNLRDLILADPRARLIPEVYLGACRRDPLYIPAAGKQVVLLEIGSHCRGAIFLNATTLVTPALERAIDAIAHLHPGFYIGRFDVRAESAEAFRAGHFKVLELNGVGAEAAHIYDPGVSLIEAYASLFRQWRLAFEIGARNRADGFQPLALGTILGAIRDRWSATSSETNGGELHPTHSRIFNGKGNQPCNNTLRSSPFSTSSMARS